MKKHWLICYSLRLVGDDTWQPTNEVTDKTPAAWLLDAHNEYMNEDGLCEVVLVSATPITAREAKQLEVLGRG